MDSVRGIADTLTLTVTEFSMDSGVATIVTSPASPFIQGGGGIVRIDTAGTILSVRLYQ
jgi:hypothetical protein